MKYRLFPASAACSESSRSLIALLCSALPHERSSQPHERTGARGTQRQEKGRTLLLIGLPRTRANKEEGATTVEEELTGHCTLRTTICEAWRGRPLPPPHPTGGPLCALCKLLLACLDTRISPKNGHLAYMRSPKIGHLAEGAVPLPDSLCLRRGKQPTKNMEISTKLQGGES